MPHDDIAAVFKALGDPGRLRCVLLLREEELTVAELTELLGLAQPTVSGVLRILMSAGLVEGRRDGRHTYYRTIGAAPWVAGALSDAALGPADIAALRRVRERRLAGEQSDPIGVAFDRSYVPGRSWKTLARSLLALARLGDVADLGVGSGELTLLLAQAARSIVAVDREPALLESLLERARRAGVENLTALAMDFEDLRLSSPVDLVVLSLSLHCAEDPIRVLEGAYRSLLPGGTIWITELQAHGHEWVREKLGHRWLGFDGETLSRWLREAGFTAVRIGSGGRDRRPPRFESFVCLGERPA